MFEISGHPKVGFEPEHTLNLMVDKLFLSFWDKITNYDYLEIRDGPSESSPLLYRISGSEYPAFLQSDQSHMWLKWVYVCILCLFPFM